MSNFIILMGPSGSGKTTICKKLYELYGLSTAFGYTTRQPREEEWGTFYVDENFFEEHEEVGDISVYTEFHGNKYCALRNQIDESDIYITDKNGIDYFVEHYEGEKQIKIIYLDISPEILYNRLVERDGEEKARSRIEHDKKAFQDAKLYADFVLTETDLKKLTMQIRHIWKYGYLDDNRTNFSIKEE